MNITPKETENQDKLSSSPKQENMITPDNDKTFNRLKELQTLLKKESALKELCKYHKILIFYSY